MALAFTAGTRWGRWSALLHYAFGAMMTAAAAFSARPWYGGPYDRTEAAIHAILAGTMGVVFAAGVITAAVTNRSARRLHTAAEILPALKIPSALLTRPVERPLSP